jgi:transcriptional regulator with XRE-family HTH domain
MTRLEFLRRSRRVTQQRLAEAVGTSQNTISAAERGARIDPAILRNLAGYFVIPAHEAEGLVKELATTEIEPAPDLTQAILAARDRR